ncbi:hypothetical protein BJ085DRAFT_41510 [Dimargaris cristalligena]|uniref:Uncharacterized protein n=1 Tax=Dimargaris cristalligena TaxID=215637 RepID=A0A4Q0A251_9FUNG|nr:hypothetical protein BJ085DRAFT_41510 [Dimargaris cristalligena]|eukprot:RKP40144.1 hypothetical protein BJ085DRAFT_41510 [Dimargaris cristalligena]
MRFTPIVLCLGLVAVSASWNAPDLYIDKPEPTALGYNTPVMPPVLPSPSLLAGRSADQQQPTAPDNSHIPAVHHIPQLVVTPVVGPKRTVYRSVEGAMVKSQPQIPPQVDSYSSAGEFDKPLEKIKERL